MLEVREQAGRVPAQMPLPDWGVVHLWHIDIHSDMSVCLLSRYLSAQENVRAQSFPNPRDRARFVSRRSILRTIAGSYLDLDPGQISFSAGEYGKLSVTGSSLSFNCASSGDLGLIAIGKDRALGVDVERIDEGFDWGPVAEIGFHPEERMWIAAQRDPRSAFTRLWASREAVFKAWGKGLHDSMASVSLVTSDALAASVPDVSGMSWWFVEFPVRAGFCAALAGNDSLARIENMHFVEGGH